MRYARPVVSGRGQSPLVIAPKSLFTFPRTALTPITASALSAQALGRQMLYGREGATFPGAGTAWPAPGSEGKNGTHTGIYGSYGWRGFGGGSSSIWEARENCPSLWVIPPILAGTHPTRKVLLVKEVKKSELEKAKEKGEGVEEVINTGTAAELSKKLTAVPIPLLANILFPENYGPFSQGTDFPVCIWDPWNDTYYEFHRLGRFKSAQEGPEGLKAEAGDFKCGDGYVVKGVSTWNGVCPVEPSGKGTGRELSASGLGYGPGMISKQDIVEILRASARGKVIALQHMLRCAIGVRPEAHIAPAVNNDASSGENTNALLADGIHLNPAYGLVDAVPEGTILTVPWESRANEFETLTHPIEKAAYETIRTRCMVVGDGNGIGFSLEWEHWHNSGSIYDTARVDPYGPSAGEVPYFKEVAERVPASWADPTLPLITETPGSGVHTPPINTLYALTGVLAPLLEQVEPSAVTAYMAVTAHKHINEAGSGGGVLVPE